MLVLLLVICSLGGGRPALEGGSGLRGTGGLPAVIDLRALYEAAAQNGLALPGIAQGWRAEVEAPALYWEYLRNFYGVQPAVPLLPEWSGGGWEGSAEIEGSALVPMFRDGMETEMEAADREEFAELQAVLGKNAPKSLAEFQDLKYNSGKWEVFKSYKRAIQIGELSALADFPLYQEISREIDEKLVGLTTSNGIKTTGKSDHFIARVIGSIQQRRSGVNMQDVFLALTDKNVVVFPVKIYPSGNMSQKFRFGNVEVSVNPKTGNLIQTNPYGG